MCAIAWIISLITIWLGIDMTSSPFCIFALIFPTILTVLSVIKKMKNKSNTNAIRL